jgi:hypothetical protein
MKPGVRSRGGTPGGLGVTGDAYLRVLGGSINVTDTDSLSPSAGTAVWGANTRPTL